jgi:hypothetical protein
MVKEVRNLKIYLLFEKIKALTFTNMKLKDSWFHLA